MIRTLSDAIEMVVGILAVFALAALIVTIVCEVRGDDALLPAIVTAFLLAVEGVLWRLRSKASPKARS